MNIALTHDQQNVLEKFKQGDNLLVLGDSGTGKSTVISHIVETTKATGRKVAVTATTGIAAQLIGGRTIHKLLRYYPGMNYDNIIYDDKVDHLEDVDVIIVDELSMMGRCFTDYFYHCLHHVDHHIQLVFVGDFFQLPPVKDNYAFTSPYWDMLHFTPCILTEVVRQDDEEFIHNINLLKYGDKRCLDYLLSYSNPNSIDGQISICATRRDARNLNELALEELSGTPQPYIASYNGTISFSDLQIEECLLVKIGMRVMSVINGCGYCNGSLGTVTNLDESSVEVLFDTGTTVCFRKALFIVERKDIIGETTELWQIPLRPASALTIHKSQGQTFQNVNIDGTKCWAPGQLYVAVSRAINIKGIHFLSPIRPINIKCDPTVKRFYDGLTR